jgi:RNA polymerase sigma factor (sigma-70 family)
MRTCIVPPAALSADCQRPTSILGPCSNEDKERTQDEKDRSANSAQSSFQAHADASRALRAIAVASISPRVGGTVLVVIIQIIAGATTSPEERYPMRDDPQVTDLVTRAGKGDQRAWDALVERYAPLIWSICRRHQLSDADTEDVGQVVWLRLMDQLDNLRDPAALPGWLATTTRRECFRTQRAVYRPSAGGQVLDAENIPDEEAATADHELLVAERNAALREAFARLPPGGQRLLALLIADPPVPYAEISARLGISVGSIGPSRSRCLGKLRRDPAIAALINTEAASTAGEIHGQPAGGGS